MRRRACTQCLARHRAAVAALRRWQPLEVLDAAGTPEYQQALAAFDAASAALQVCVTEGHAATRRLAAR